MQQVTNITAYAKITPFKGVVYTGKTNSLVLRVQNVFPETLATTDRLWTDVDRMVLHLLSFDADTGEASAIVATADTDVTASLIDYSKDGKLTLVLGSLLAVGGGAIPDGEYLVRITSYVGAVATQVLHETNQIARIFFVDTETA